MIINSVSGSVRVKKVFLSDHNIMIVTSMMCKCLFGHIPNLICPLVTCFLFYIMLLLCNASNCLRSELFFSPQRKKRRRRERKGDDFKQEEREKQMLPQEEG